MSAYICNPEQFALLAVTAYKRGLVVQAEEAAEMLARENIASVAYAYPGEQDGDRPGPGLKDADVVKAARIWAGYYMATEPGASPHQILQACRCLDYQCGHPEFEASAAKKLLDRIESSIGIVPEGDFAWGWRDPETLPEIQALYEEETA